MQAECEQQVVYIRGTVALRIVIVCVSCDRTFIPIRPQQVSEGQFG